MKTQTRTIIAHYGKVHYWLDLSPSQVEKYNNYVMTSCGLTIPDDMPVAALNWLIRNHRAHELSETEANHW